MKKIFVTFGIIALFFSLNSCQFVNAAEYSGISHASLLMKFKDVNRSWRVAEKLKSQARGLAENDKKTIKKYVYGAITNEDSFTLTNCYLNGNLDTYISKKDITKPLEARLDFYARSLETSVNKAKLPQNMLLYHISDDREMRALFKDKNINEILIMPVNDDNLNALKSAIKGSKFCEKGFWITTYDQNMTKKSKYRFIISAPKNLRAVLLDEISGIKAKEVLISSGYKWEVTGISKEYDKRYKVHYYKINVKLIMN
ncbi:hypothetical protein IJ750_07085 [bacterium]|nr:hypothetical protein [bacterium]